MTRVIAAAALTVMGTAGGVWALYLSCPGCIERSRVNAACEWRGDATFALDLAASSDRRHLTHDAQLAEDLAIRYADAEYRHRSGYDGHGGLVDNGDFRNRCMAALVAAIEQNHSVTFDEVRFARGRRNLVFDVAATVLFLPVYVLLAAFACAALQRRFSSDPRPVIIAATGFAALAASFVGAQLLELWLAVWEAVRVGNGHISVFRAATWNRWNQTHHTIEFAAGVVLFWVVSALVLKIVPSRQEAAWVNSNSHSLAGNAR